MRKKDLVLCMGVVIMLIILSCTGYGLAENEDGLHLYQGIPFEGTTQEAVLQILLKKTGVPFEVSNTVWSGNAYGIMDFGYKWNLQLDFNENYIGTDRILLSSAQSARVALTDFQERLRSDLLQFIDVEGQLTALYGEPDYRFFFMKNINDKYMFPSGAWDVEQMMGVCEAHLAFKSFSIWGNVVFQTWIDALDFRYAEKPLSRVMLYYYPEIMPAPSPITQYLPPKR